MINKLVLATSLALGLSVSSLSSAITTSVSVNQTIAESKVSITQPIIAYFDSIDNDTDIVNQPAKDGFYRVLLGRNAQGHYLIQDYFQNTGKPQTEPYWVISAEGLTDFGIDYIHGPLIGYFTNGKPSFKGNMSEGEYKTPFESFYTNGQVANRTSPLAKGYSRDEYFYDNGKKAVTFEYDADGELTKTQAWDKNGKVLGEEEADAIEDEILDLIRFDQ